MPPGFVARALCACPPPCGDVVPEVLARARSIGPVTVYLVGAGPGDPGLLTVRGAELLAAADVVVYDRLSVEALLDLAPAGAERISVGKAPGQVTMAQDDINSPLVARGRSGGTVARPRPDERRLGKEGG